MKKKWGPWTITARRTVYENPWLSVEEDEVIRPNKEKGIFSVVHQRKGVSVIPLDEAGNVFLTREYHYAVGRETIEAVSGGIEKDETSLAAAKRELQEEIGLRAGQWTYLGVINPFPTAIDSPNHMYLAEKLKTTAATPEGTEIITTVTIPFKQAVELVMNSTILHAATAVALLKIQALRSNSILHL